jgi:hypothetical protein
VPWNAAVAMVDDGRIEDAKSIIALTVCDRLFRRQRRFDGGPGD